MKQGPASLEAGPVVVHVRVFRCEPVKRMDGSPPSPLSYAHIFAGEFGDRLHTSPRFAGERCTGGASPRRGGPKMCESDSGLRRDDGGKITAPPCSAAPLT